MNKRTHPPYLAFAHDVRIETVALGARALAVMVDDPRPLRRVAAILEHDRVLRARTLSVANALVYDPGSQAPSVEEACERLGVHHLHHLIVAICHQALFPRFGDEERQMWLECLSSALIAHGIAAETGLASPEDAFVAGLLSDVGKAVMKSRAPEAFGESLRVARERCLPSHEAELVAFGYTHVDVAAYLIEAAGLSEDLYYAVLLHHDDSLGEVVSGPYSGLCEVARRAADGGSESKTTPIDAGDLPVAPAWR
jgi:HD-like signal output (HDOD) protein